MTHTRSFFLIGLTVLLAGCAWFGGTPEEPETEPVAMTFQELRMSGEDQRCTFTDESDGSTTSGTVYVAGDGRSLRGDFAVTEADGQTFQGSMIRQGTVGYVWNTVMTQGIMMEFPEGDDTVFGQDEGGEGLGLSENEPVAFLCEPWNIDSNFFEPPADREFQNLSDQLELIRDEAGAPEIDVNAPNAACAACDQIPDADAKAQCQAALGC
ncbi:MAG TPA: hypothetical protein VI913_01615 [Candidatus Peribacteraceae bacterium]|nr:hypothetical protein [Candidatus Peribacteraceae bacterium]